jgi:hypothetical protein
MRRTDMGQEHKFTGRKSFRYTAAYIMLSDFYVKKIRGSKNRCTLIEIQNQNFVTRIGSFIHIN